MADTERTDGKSPEKRSRRPLVLGVLLAFAGAGGGFLAAFFDLLPGSGTFVSGGGARPAVHAGAMPAEDVEFVAIEPLVISLNSESGTHLRFRAQLEVNSAHRSEVEHLLPRVVDVLNGYLRAVDLADLRNNAALVRLRAQMLRRVQMVTGGDRVSDLLIMEFVLN
ncbi:MAG: flagellar basal body-associated FliL family protein [Roseovarius sp.]|nr:flagellar basal body-associated FliL family protein [Roseovarius sp.]